MRSEPDKTDPNASNLAALVTPDSRPPAEQTGARLRMALVLFHDGVAMKRAALRRELPTASPEELDARIRSWLVDRPHDRPGASAGRSIR